MGWIVLFELPARPDRALMRLCQMTRSSERNSRRSARPPRKAIREYFKRYLKEQFQTEVESWRHLQSQNFEFTMKRLREPIGG